MITIIGTRLSVIGFGLCGIRDTHEVSEGVSATEIEQLITNAKSNVVMIEEALLKNVTINHDKIIVPIPDRFEKPDYSDLDNLVKDTVGVSIDVKHS